MNNPAMQRRVDQLLATAPQRAILGVLAALTVFATTLALSVASTGADGWLVVLITLFAIGAVLQPDDHLGLVTIVLVAIHWLVAGLPTTSPWSLAVAVALLVFHSLLAVMAVTPHTTDLPAALLITWLRRCFVVGVATIGVWGLVVVLDRREAPGSLGLSVAAYVAVVVAIVALHVGQRRPRGGHQ